MCIIQVYIYNGFYGLVKVLNFTIEHLKPVHLEWCECFEHSPKIICVFFQLFRFRFALSKAQGRAMEIHFTYDPAFEERFPFDGDINNGRRSEERRVGKECSARRTRNR